MIQRFINFFRSLLLVSGILFFGYSLYYFNTNVPIFATITLGALALIADKLYDYNKETWTKSYDKRQEAYLRLLGFWSDFMIASASKADALAELVVVKDESDKIRKELCNSLFHISDSFGRLIMDLLESTEEAKNQEKTRWLFILTLNQARSDLRKIPLSTRDQDILNRLFKLTRIDQKEIQKQLKQLAKQ